MTDIETDVLIVGAGPAGLTASALLARLGVKFISVTKYDSTADSPRAHITNQRSMEIFRDLGFADRVRARAMPQDLMGTQVFATSFAGLELARTRGWGAGVDRRSDYERASPTSMCNIPQHVLEPIILEAAAANGAEIRFGHELLELNEVEDGIDALIRNRQKNEEYQIRAKYVVGADGGRSIVARQMQISFEGKGKIGDSVSVWLKADLSRYVRHRSGALAFIYHPGSEVLFSVWPCVNPWDEWNPFFLRHNFADGDVSELWIRQQIEAAIGDCSVKYEIKKVTKWQVNHLVAKQYRKGRVFLVGDAAHRHSPANGLGSNTSIQDSYNLAWKLALVLSGHASEALLDSYDAERRPVGQQVIARAHRSGRDMSYLWQALGVRPDQAAEEARKNIDLLFAGGEVSAQARRSVWDALDLMNGQFNAHGVELGQRYASHAIVQDETLTSPKRTASDLYYRPSTDAGAHLPHVWIEKDRRQTSTLDLVAYDGFTLISGIQGDVWHNAASLVAKEFDVPVSYFPIGLRQEYDDVFGDWARIGGIDDDGCILVRPDRFVAWRSKCGATKSAATAALRNAMAQILGR
ncbi:MAG: 2,4-dichlorophenol 6-monooxygenase [Gammaproteobacteria bacterium]|nr:2,4-dichlorophenol 6-monooxygenase [Gammaproteobacteria bacterium]